jgi:solute carrier family 35 protein E3
MDSIQKSRVAATAGKLLDPNNVVVVSLVINVVSSVLTIVLNKTAAMGEAFKFGTLLTVFHFLFAHAALRILAKFEVFKIVDIPSSVKFPLVSAYAGYVFFNNISLLTNSVSFYQITKLLVTPLVLVIQSRFYGMNVSRKVKLSLLPLLVGSSVYISTDVHTSIQGAMFALLATVSNALYTVWGGTMQRNTHANGMQILFHQSMWSAILLFPAIFFFDDFPQMRLQGFHARTLWISFATGPCALLLNLSFFVFVGKTSPLTANVLGYLKTMLVLLAGCLYFGDRLDGYSIFGISCTMLGLLLYTKTKMEENK